jgi:Asp/Glu/hydantoin racemase
MVKRLALIHTVSSIIDPFQDLCCEILPDIEIFNILDESLLKNVIEIGELAPQVYKRVTNYVVSAQEAGADAVLITCSSISPCADVAQKLVDIPVMKIDEAMADKAVEIGKRIGVIATLSTTLEPTTDLVKSRGALKNKEVSVKSILCEGAFEAVTAGDAATHDKIVKEGLKKLMAEVDVIVLAQASMACVVEGMTEEEKSVPILSSPRLGMERAKQVLAGLGAKS